EVVGDPRGRDRGRRRRALCSSHPPIIPEPARVACGVMVGYHVAQLNIGRLRAPLDSPQLAAFVEALEPVNALADRAPGFVWRLQTEEGDATALRPFPDDMMLVNMSVWESVEALADFVYRSAHRDILRRRREFFEPMEEAFTVLWWV